MSALDLTAYKSVESNLFIKITLASSTLLFSDRLVSTTIAGDTYVGLGKLMAVSSSSSEIRSSGNEVTITISGIPDSAITDITNANIKGSNVKVIRGLFSATTGEFITAITGNPVTRFTGYVNNISLQEEYDVDTRTSSNTLLLICASNVDVLENKVSGRRTNPTSQKAFYPSDVSMDRIPALESSFFDFGAKL